MMDKIAIVDTTFARFDMRAVAENELKRQPGFGKKFELVRATVPGIKDLAVACKRLIERESCSIALRSERRVVRSGIGSAPTKRRSA